MKLVSYNVCGLQKLVRHDHVLATLRACDIVLIQESLLLAPTKLFPGFVSFDVPAVVTRSRNSGGLAILVKRASLGATSFEVLVQDAHVLAVLLRWPQSSLLVCTVYAPLSSTPSHTEFYVKLFAQLQAIVETVLPAAVFVAGDFNAHRFRPSSRRDRDFIEFCSMMAADEFQCFPNCEEPFTYVSGTTSSTIDYILHRGLGDVRCRVDDNTMVAQHRPLFVDFSATHHVAPAMLPAPGAAYWRSKKKAADFPASLALFPPAYECTSSSSLQQY